MLKSINCPNCGSAVEIDSYSADALCNYCDTEFPVRKEYKVKPSPDKISNYETLALEYFRMVNYDDCLLTIGTLRSLDANNPTAFFLSGIIELDKSFYFENKLESVSVKFENCFANISIDKKEAIADLFYLDFLKIYDSKYSSQRNDYLASSDQDDYWGEYQTFILDLISILEKINKVYNDIPFVERLIAIHSDFINDFMDKKYRFTSNYFEEYDYTAVQEEVNKCKEYELLLDELRRNQFFEELKNNPPDEYTLKIYYEQEHEKFNEIENFYKKNDIERYYALQKYKKNYQKEESEDLEKLKSNQKYFYAALFIIGVMILVFIILYLIKKI